MIPFGLHVHGGQHARIGCHVGFEPRESASQERYENRAGHYLAIL